MSLCICLTPYNMDFPVDTNSKELACQCRRHRDVPWVRALGQEDPLKESMTTHSNIFACRISRTEESGRL